MPYKPVGRQGGEGEVVIWDEGGAGSGGLGSSVCFSVTLISHSSLDIAIKNHVILKYLHYNSCILRIGVCVWCECWGWVGMVGVGGEGGGGRGVVRVYPSAFFSQSLYLCKLQHLEFKGNS